jgi:hypothetical protein
VPAVVVSALCAKWLVMCTDTARFLMATEMCIAEITGLYNIIDQLGSLCVALFRLLLKK